MLYGIDESKLYTNILGALNEWDTVGGTPAHLLEDLLLIKQVRQNDSSIKARLATNQLLLECITQLGQQNRQLAEILELRFIEKLASKEIAFNKNESIDKVNRLQRKAVDQLTQIIQHREGQLRRTLAEEMSSRLPPSQYTKLFGFDEAIEFIQSHVVNPERSWVTAIVGMGGMGKTALSDFVTRELIKQFIFEEIIWIRVASSPIDGRLQSPELTFDSLIAQIAYELWPDSANALTDQNRLNRVRQVLHERPYLVVIDNLEAVTDTAFLFDYFNELANPTKFLLTTRIQPPRQSNVFGYHLDGLNFEQASALLAYHAEDIGITLFKEATEQDYREIYSATGGNPFALRLVISMLDTYPLPHLLENLHLKVDGDVYEMYQRIFRQAWQSLSSNAKKLLKAMPLVSQDGADPDFLRKIIDVPEHEIWPLISELKNRSLIESRGGLSKRRYGIHQLTNTFLKSEIINWKTEAWKP